MTDPTNATTHKVEEEPKPKRPPNGYNLFYKEFRQRRAEEIKDARMGGLKALTDSVAKAWKHLDPSLRNRYNALGKKYQTKYRKDMEMWLDRQRAIHQKAINARQQATRRLNECEIADYIKRLRDSGVIRPWSPVDKKHSGHVTGEAPSQDVDDICTAKETLSSDGCSGDDSFSQETTCGSIVLDCDDLGRGLLVTDGIYWTANQTTEFQLAGDDAFGSTVEAHTGEAGWDFLEDSQDFRIFPHESA